jgi:hypothetical protein
LSDGSALFLSRIEDAAIGTMRFSDPVAAKCGTSALFSAKNAEKSAAGAVLDAVQGTRLLRFTTVIKSP